jgi:Transcriptional regulator
MKHYSDIQSLQRAFDLLDIVGSSESALSLKEIALESGLPRSSTYRFLRNLEYRGYLRCDEEGRYHLGLKLLYLQQRGEQKFDLKNQARPYLENLSGITGETVHLGVLFENRVLYVDSLESSHLIRMVAQVGSTIGVYCTSLGKALVMDLSEQEIQAILKAEPLKQLTQWTLTSEKSFLDAVKQARRQGFAVDERENNPDSRCVGAPIRDREGRIVGALSISGPISRMAGSYMKDVAIPALLRETGELSKMLGYSEEKLKDQQDKKAKRRRKE